MGFRVRSPVGLQLFNIDITYMNTLHKKHISFDSARKLHELNIQIPSRDGYAIDHFTYFPPRINSEYEASPGTWVRDIDNCESEYSSISISNLTIPAPTLHDVVDYFRETFDIFISVGRLCNPDPQYLYEIEYSIRGNYVCVSGDVSTDYYECLSNAIQNVLDNILPAIKIS